MINNFLHHTRLIFGILIGIVGVAAIVLDSLHRRRDRRDAITPELGDIDTLYDSTVHSDLEDDILRQATVPQTAPSNPQPVQRSLSELDPKDLLLLHIVAPQGAQFCGYELLQTILANDFRFGQMSVFHRFADKSMQGDILFSLASATAAGTFDINNMGGFSSPALTMYMDLSRETSNLASFEIFLTTAEQMAEDLKAILIDEQRKKLCDESLQHYRQRFDQLTVA